ncbi:MAG: DNA primase [Patescibacteria group bacterium]|nr:DNA primase [Patescibacteria group bacterium]
MDNVTEQIKERINVVDVISEYLKLEKAGANYKALCPFHNEKTPSFIVNPERNFWYCFGCQKGGDIFSFIMEMEGMEFRDALERLAERAGIELPKFSPGAVKERSSKQRLLEILDIAARYYQEQLKKHPKRWEIIKYLRARNVTDDLIDNFRIGYAPGGWTNILSFLKAKGYGEPDIEKTGLLVKKQNAGNERGIYDRFRDRIMFPVLDVSGKTVGFSARVAPGADESSAKYINTPETQVYDKSAVLYGLYQGKMVIRSNDLVIIVEGNMDVVASHFAGVKNIVAVSGTALTPRHANILKRYTQNVKLCFDMDEAGQRATRKSIQTCLQTGLDVEVILLPKGQKDVSDLVSADSKKWPIIVEKGIVVMEYFFNKILKQYDSNDVRTKKIVARDLLNIIKDIADPIEQSYWLKKLASSIDVDEEVLTEVLEKSSVKKERENRIIHTQQNNKTITKQKTRQEILEERLLGLFVLYPDDLKKKAKNLSYQFIGENQKLWNDFISGKAESSTKLDECAMKVKYIRDGIQGLIENEIDPLKDWEETVIELNKAVKDNRLAILKHDIKKAKEQGDEQAINILMKELAIILSYEQAE